MQLQKGSKCNLSGHKPTYAVAWYTYYRPTFQRLSTENSYSKSTTLWMTRCVCEDIVLIITSPKQECVCI